MSRLFRAACIALCGLAGCTDAIISPTVPAQEPAARMALGSAQADRVTAAVRWTQRTREIIGRRGGDSNIAARTYALVSVARYNAVIAAEDAKARGQHPSESGAAAAAAAGVLEALYPAEQAFIQAALSDDAAYLSMLPAERHADFDAGLAVGRNVAAAVLAYGADDRSGAVWTGTAPVGPEYWIPAPPPARPSGALWGEVRPWLLTSGDQFRPAPPPALGSPEFLEALAEVRSFSDTRTEEQLEIARFWAGSYGPGGPAGYFGNFAAELATRQHFDERRSARLLAVVHMAIMDASIACYDAKYTYWYLRPYQADPGITTPVGRPNFPSYPSAHSCLSAAAAGVLAAFFPAATDELRADVEEAGMSRIYGGLHFRFEITAGREIGEAVAALAVRLAPAGHQAIPLD